VYVTGDCYRFSGSSSSHSRIHAIASDDGYLRHPNANAPWSWTSTNLVIHWADESTTRIVLSIIVLVLFFSSNDKDIIVCCAGQVYTNLGINDKLKLTGRPLRPIGALGTSKVIFVPSNVFLIISSLINVFRCTEFAEWLFCAIRLYLKYPSSIYIETCHCWSMTLKLNWNLSADFGGCLVDLQYAC